MGVSPMGVSESGREKLFLRRMVPVGCLQESRLLGEALAAPGKWPGLYSVGLEGSVNLL